MKVANLLGPGMWVLPVKSYNCAVRMLQALISGPRNGVPAYFNPWMVVFSVSFDGCLVNESLSSVCIPAVLKDCLLNVALDIV